MSDCVHLKCLTGIYFYIFDEFLCNRKYRKLAKFCWDKRLINFITSHVFILVLCKRNALPPESPKDLFPLELAEGAHLVSSLPPLEYLNALNTFRVCSIDSIPEYE